jgi:TonB family protein
MKTLLFLSMLFCIPVSLFRQVDNALEEIKATQTHIRNSLETIPIVFKFNIHLQIADTIKDTTHQLTLLLEAPDNTPSTYNMPIYVPDSSKNSFKKIPYEDLMSQHPNGQVFFIVEDMPEFPGGELALHKWIANEIKYPVIAQENGIQGKVYVTFVIGKDGSVSNANVARGVDSSLDKEALRVVNALPKWKPGKQRGKQVNVSYTLPIEFKLQHNIK